MVSFTFLYLTFLLSLGGQSTSTGLPQCSIVQSTLVCDLRKLSVDFLNSTVLTSATEVTLRCNPQLLFESTLSLLQLFPKLVSLNIVHCKIRRLEPKSLQGLTSLTQFTLQTYNAQWSGSFSLVVDPTGFNGLAQLESLDLSHSNIVTLPPNVFCPLGSLKRLNLSGNRLSEVIRGDTSDSVADCTWTNSLQNLDLSQNSIQKIDSKSFGHKLTKLQRVFLQGNQIDQVDRASWRGLNQLKLLNLSSNRIVSLPSTLFDTNQLLEVVHLGNNFLVELSGNEFRSLVNLQELYLQSNQIQAVKNVTFHKLKSLQILRLDDNRLEVIDPQTFTQLTSLSYLDLSRNRLATLDPLLIQNLGYLQRLYLDYNQLRYLDDNFLQNQVNLKDLGLGVNFLTEVPTTLRSLRALESLDIGENRISKVTNESFRGLEQIYGLRLVANRLSEIPAGFCSELKKLHILNLAQNEIRTLSQKAFVGCPLRALRLDGNHLEALVPGTLRPQLESLVWLNLSENRLQRVSYDQVPPFLEWLDLSKNQLVTLTGSHEPLQYLRALDLSYNNLSRLDQSKIPPQLETLRVNFNKLTTLDPDTLSKASRLRKAEFLSNQLTSITLSSIRIPASVDAPLPEIFLGGNPFLCDCSLEWLTRPGQLSELGQYPQVIDLDGITCRVVNSNVTKFLRDMNSTEFLCPYKSHCFALCQCCDFEACDCAMTCPDNCTCYHDVSWRANIVQCSNLGYREPPPKIPMDASVIFLDGNFFQELANHIFIGKKNVRALYLNGSQVQVIRNKTFNGLRVLEELHLERNALKGLEGHEFADCHTLVELYLQNNQIQAISEATFVNLKALRVLRLDGNRLTNYALWELSTNVNLNQILISGNPWSCACVFLIPFTTWIETRNDRLVMDYELARCQMVAKVIPIQSACRDPVDVSKGYRDNDLLDLGGSISEREAIIHHSYLETSLSNKGHVLKSGTSSESDEQGRSSGGTLWSLSASVAAILIVIAIVAAIRLKVRYNCQDGCPRSRHRRRVSLAEKVVGEDCSSTFLSDTSTSNNEESKLFDVYFLYNEQDEELVIQKVASSLDPTGTLRVLLHYRDLREVRGHRHGDMSLNPDITLSAAETSKSIVIVMSQTFLEADLFHPMSRLSLQLVIQRFSAKLLFILLPPLNPLGVLPVLQELGAKTANTAILDWIDPNFWPKLRSSLLPLTLTRLEPEQPAILMEPRQNERPSYTQSLSRSQFQRNITPYQLQVPPYSHNYEYPYQGPTSTLRLSPSSEQFPNSECVPCPSPRTSTKWKTLQATPAPVLTSFAANFRYHQQQHHHPRVSSVRENDRDTLEKRSSSRNPRSPTHPYRPLVRKPPPPLSPQIISVQSSTTDDSGQGNCCSSSDELENEHVYTTLNSPLPSTTTSPPGDTVGTGTLCQGQDRDRMKYFV